MKQADLIVLGLAGVAVWFILKNQSKTSSTSTGKQQGIAPGERVQEIFDSAGLPFDNGWRYYNDGTTIDPQGNYYKGGQLIWKAPGN